MFCLHELKLSLCIKFWFKLPLWVYDEIGWEFSGIILYVFNVDYKAWLHMHDTVILTCMFQFNSFCLCFINTFIIGDDYILAISHVEIALKRIFILRSTPQWFSLWLFRNGHLIISVINKYHKPILWIRTGVLF